METKLKIIFFLTLAVSIPTWFSELYSEDTAWLIRDLSLMFQSLMIAVMIYWFVRNEYIKVFALYLIIWRMTGLVYIYLEYNGQSSEAMILSYCIIILFFISLLHLAGKCYYSTQRY